MSLPEEAKTEAGAAQAAPVGANPKAIWRCESCQGLLLHADITTGGCATCGGRRVRLAVAVTEDEIAQLKARGYEFDSDLWSESPVLNRQPRVG